MVFGLIRLNPTHVFSPSILIIIASVLLSVKDEAPRETSTQEALFIVPQGQLAKQPIDLKGIWEFYPNELIESNGFLDKSNQTFVIVPSWWAEEEGKSSVQYGTYRLKVLMASADQQQSLALEMPDVYCAYELWLNGELVGQNGIVGRTKETSKPQWKPETYFFKQNKDTLEIVVKLSNFYHYRTGINNPLVLGSAEHLKKDGQRTEISNFILLAGLTILGLIGIVLYFMRSSIQYVLYSLLCFSWVVRAAFSNHYQIVQWFEDINWHFLVRTEYISLYLSTLFGSLLVGSLFPKEVSKVFRIIYIIACFSFTVFTLGFSPMLFTTYIQLYLGLSSILLLSIIVIVARAYSESREGVTLILAAAAMAVAMFGYVIMAYQGLFSLNDMFFNIGFLLMFILTLMAVSERIQKMGSDRDYGKMTFDGTMTKVR